MGLPIFSLYIYYSYKNYISKKILTTTIIFNIPGNYLIFFGDIYHLTNILFIYEIYTILTIIVSLLFLVYLIKKKEFPEKNPLLKTLYKKYQTMPFATNEYLHAVQKWTLHNLLTTLQFK